MPLHAPAENDGPPRRERSFPPREVCASGMRRSCYSLTDAPTQHAPALNARPVAAGIRVARPAGTELLDGNAPRTERRRGQRHCVKGQPETPRRDRNCEGHARQNRQRLDAQTHRGEQQRPESRGQLRLAPTLLHASRVYWFGLGVARRIPPVRIAGSSWSRLSVSIIAYAVAKSYSAAAMPKASYQG